jgi:glycerol-3-phosphate cytidylyltransferase/D-beta-D-heptose 7-phosphate kinase/D-beta-D-heptose 1-phosphate adenosyltransferase
MERPAPDRASIVSGYFGPLHTGHLDLFEAARERSGYLVVIVNNDRQQVLKKGRMIQPDTERARIVAALGCVDDVLIAVEDGPGIDGSFDVLRERYPDAELEFCNGGDRSSVATLPPDELAAAERNRISLVYGVGGTEKADSSTRILAAMEEPSQTS